MCEYFCIGLIDFILKRKCLFVNMKWLTEISKICPEEHLLIKYYVIKYLLLIKIQNIMDIKEVSLQGFIIFDKTSSGDAIESEIILNQQLTEELHKPITRKSEKKKNTDLLKTIFGMLI